MGRHVEVDEKCGALEHPKQWIDVDAVVPQEVRRLGQHRLASHQRRPKLLHDPNGPIVVRIVAVEVSQPLPAQAGIAPVRAKTGKQPSAGVGAPAM